MNIFKKNCQLHYRSSVFNYLFEIEMFQEEFGNVGNNSEMLKYIS